MRRNSRRLRRASGGIALAALAALAAACTLMPAPKPAPRNTFLLWPEPGISGASPAQPGTAAETLVVTLPREEPGFDTARMAYLRSPNAVSYYADSQWADTPARMLLPAMAQALERTGRFRAVVRTPTAVAAEYRLDTEDLVLGQEFFSRPSRARLALRAVLVDAREERVVAARRFEAVEAAPTDDAAGGAAAAGRAAAKLVESVAAWVGESLPAAAPRADAPRGD